MDKDVFASAAIKSSRKKGFWLNGYFERTRDADFSRCLHRLIRRLGRRRTVDHDSQNNHKFRINAPFGSPSPAKWLQK